MEKRRFIGAALIVVLLAGGFYWWQGRRPTAPVAIQSTGTIEATTVDLSAKQAGTLSTVAVQSGDQVQQGQLVAALTRNDLAAQRERDALAVLKAQDALNDLLAGPREQEKAQASASVNIAQANYSQAASDLAKAQSLFDAGAIAQADLDKAKTVSEVSRNQLEAAKAALNLMEAGARPEQVNAARTEVERSQAVLKAAEAVLSDLQVYVPLSGVVISRNFEPGEFVQMGAPLLTVADLTDLWVRVYVATGDLPFVKLGQPVTFAVTGLDQTFAGTVEQIASKGEFTPKTIQTKQERANVVYGVKIKIDSAGGILKPGMPADVTF